MPARAAVRLEREREFPVAPESNTPFIRQTNVNGPAPAGVVANETVPPAQTVALVNGVAVVPSRTISAPLLVTLPH